MNVKILHKIFLLLLLATFMLTSCHDDDEPIDEPTEQTVIFFTNTECQTLCDLFSLCIIKYFLNIISPNNDMKAKIDALLSAYPSIDTSAMGFPHGWENEPLWQ